MSRIKIKNSIVCLGGIGEQNIKDLVRNFDLASATPIDCMKFIGKLKEIINGTLKTTSI